MLLQITMAVMLGWAAAGFAMTAHIEPRGAWELTFRNYNRNYNLNMRGEQIVLAHSASYRMLVDFLAHTHPQASLGLPAETSPGWEQSTEDFVCELLFGKEVTVKLDSAITPEALYVDIADQAERIDKQVEAKAWRARLGYSPPR